MADTRLHVTPLVWSILRVHQVDSYLAVCTLGAPVSCLRAIYRFMVSPGLYAWDSGESAANLNCGAWAITGVSVACPYGPYRTTTTRTRPLPMPASGSVGHVRCGSAPDFFLSTACRRHACIGLLQAFIAASGTLDSPLVRVSTRPSFSLMTPHLLSQQRPLGAWMTTLARPSLGCECMFVASSLCIHAVL